MGTASSRDFYRLSAEEVLHALQSKEEGLSTQEATSRLAQYGPNVLEAKHRESPFVTYLRQFKDPMIALLAVSSIIAYFLEDPRTAVVLLVLVFFNTTIGFLQEFKAEKIMESLEKLVIAEATVVRDGAKHSVASADLTVGDVVYIEAGSAVPADLRLIEEEELSTNDFALTGESNPSRKFTHAIPGDVPLANRHNLVFMGTTVATGQAIGVVTAVGTQTELGRIANLSQGIADQVSPLQKEMNNIAKRVTMGTMLLCVVLLPVAISAGLAIKDALLFAIGIASSLIPQGLPAEINTALAQAASKLARAKALVKKLSAVEGLGATNIILTDKTGTLTKNQMTVEQVHMFGHTYHISGKGYEPTGDILDEHKQPLAEAALAPVNLISTAAALASNARVSAPDSEHNSWYVIGDPTEGALITLAMKAGINMDHLDKLYREIREFPFDSGRKRMSSLRYFGPTKKDQRPYLFVKGAPENVLECCTKIWDNGKLRSITLQDKQRIRRDNERLAGNAMRNLGIAYRIIPVNAKLSKLSMENAEQQLVWLGMISMIDPLREQVPNAMEAARHAHLKVSIITGDFAATAKAIALRAKLAGDANDIVVVSGEELKRLSNTHILHLVQKGGAVFSRVAPEDKLRIVEIVQHSGKVVTVTGDGINDAPALKRADIGVAMGMAGTDVAKQSADVILLDDSFTTLVGTVQEGRTIFQNIKKGTLSCFTSNAAELVVMIISLTAATLFHIPLAISVMQILAIDLVAELFPIAALGRDKADGELMRQHPRKTKDHILTRAAILDLLWCGLLIGGFAFANYILFFGRYDMTPGHVPADSLLHMKATALTYLTIVLCQLANIMQRRSSHGFFSRYQFHNRQFWLAIAFSLFCVVNIIYNPWIAPYFKAGSLSAVDWLFALGAAALFIAIREFQRHNKKHSRKAVLDLHRSHRLKLRRA